MITFSRGRSIASVVSDRGPALFGSCALGALMACGLAAAPAPAHAEADAPAKGSGVEVSELVVTAQKREERLQDVPISISVVTPAVLAATNAKNLTELSGAVPGVQFNGNGGGGRTYLSMRGTSGSALNTGDEPVAIYMDDVYLARGVAIGTEDLLDMGSIEIVRGPQGTLQGRNATAGAILLHSADPTSTPEGYFSAQAKDTSEYRFQGAVSGPLGNGFTGRLSAGGVDARGWAKNTFDGSHIAGGESGQIRAVVAYSGDSPLTARLSADYGSISNTPALFRNAATTFSTSPTGNLIPVATPNVPLPAAQKDAIYNDNNYSSDPTTHTTLDVGGAAAKLTYALGAADLVSISGYRYTHVFGQNNSAGLATPPRLGFNNNDDRSSEFSQELRLQSHGDTRFSWITGLYYFHEDQDYADTIYNLQFSTPTSTASFYHGNQKTDSYAAFADATFKVTDQFQIIGGVRYSHDHKDLNSGIQVTNTITGAVTNTPYVGSASWADTTYRVKAVYHPITDVMLFIGYGTGFRAGGYNDFAVQPPFAPETNASLEGGIKGDFLDRRLSLSFTAYQNEYKNLQLRAGVPTGGAIITNAGASEIKGFEFEVNARPFEHTVISANTAYTDAYFKTFPKAVDIFNNFVNAAGNSLPNAPKWAAFASIGQEFPLRNGWMAVAEANFRWRDKIYFYFTNQNATPWYDGAGGTVGARVSLHSPDNKWTFAAFGSNLNNARIVQTDVVTFSYPEVSLNEPRVFGISVDRRF
jgi:iron complex outermembrane receptor protein